MAGAGRGTGLRSDMRRAAPDIYWMIRQEGHANVREWWQSVWGQTPESQHRSSMWHSACAVDLRVEEMAKDGPQALAANLESDDLVEGLLRQLASAREFALTHDSAAASRILGFRMPGESITPQWLLDDANQHSQSMHKQTLRTRKPESKAAAAAAVAGGGKGKGKGAARGRGQPAQGLAM